MNCFQILSFTLFGSSSSLQPNSVFLSHCSNIIFQPPANQEYFSLTLLQPSEQLQPAVCGQYVGSRAGLAGVGDCILSSVP